LTRNANEVGEALLCHDLCVGAQASDNLSVNIHVDDLLVREGYCFIQLKNTCFGAVAFLALPKV
jgi:hypothetical protein